MKVETCVKNLDFNPVEVKLTFETAEELKLFKHLMWTSLSVPPIAFTNSRADADALKNLMKTINADVRYL